MSHYIHHVPGRLRIKCHGLKRNLAMSSAISEFLSDFSGIAKHQINPVTGSIVINYDPNAACPKQILTTLQSRYAVAPGAQVQESANNSRLSKGGSKMTGSFGKAVVGFAVEKLVERSAIILIGALL